MENIGFVIYININGGGIITLTYRGLGPGKTQGLPPTPPDWDLSVPTLKFRRGFDLWLKFNFSSFEQTGASSELFVHPKL